MFNKEYTQTVYSFWNIFYVKPNIKFHYIYKTLWQLRLKFPFDHHQNEI